MSRQMEARQLGLTRRLSSLFVSLQEKLSRDRTHGASTHACQPESTQAGAPAANPFFFEFLVVVSLQQKTADSPYEPLIIYKFPKEMGIRPLQREEEEKSLQAITLFCFPEGVNWTPLTQYQSETFSFVLTEMDGSRRNGFCRRLLPHGKGKRSPEAYCIVSKAACFGLFSKIFDEVEKRREKSMAMIYPFMQSLREAPFPEPGETVQIKSFIPESGTEIIMLTRPLESWLEHVDFQILFCFLSNQEILQVFASALMERRIVFISEELGTLSQVLHAVAALLTPFTWQHTFISTVPMVLMEVLMAPTPFLLGVTKTMLDNAFDKNDADNMLIVDLSSKEKERFLQCIGDEDSILPETLQNELLEALCAKKDNSTAEEINTLVSEAFVSFFVKTVGHYSAHVKRSRSHQPGVFQRKSFCRATESKAHRQFVTNFITTQMFDVFIQDVERRPASDEGDRDSGPLLVSVADCTVDSCKPGVRMGKNPNQSPFKLPEDKRFLLLTTRQEHSREEMRRYLALPVHEKLSYMGRMKASQREMRRELEPEEEEEEMGNIMSLVVGNPAMRMAMIKRKNIKKESMQEFLYKRREMFRQEYSVMVKRAEIQRLEEVHLLEEQRMRRAEQLLEQDQLLFEKFLKENNQNSVEAIQIAEKETKCKLEKMAEIKKLTSELVTIKSDISKKEEMLKEYKMYKDFLFKLSPPDWREAQQAKTQQAKALHAKALIAKTLLGKAQLAKMQLARAQRAKAKAAQADRDAAAVLDRGKDPAGKAGGTKRGGERGEEPELYFTEPQQLLDLLTELEEQNLTLIQNSRETEEALEELQGTMAASKKKTERDTEQLRAQIDTIAQTIATEKERATELELKARLYNFGKCKSADEDQMLDALGRKVEEVYRCCVGDMQANLTTLQMLAVIESHLLQLLENMENIPRATLDQVEKIKDRERRMRQRVQKLEQQKEHQEDRIKKAMERAQANIRKTNSRRLMPRSNPVTRKIEYSNVNSGSEQDELHAYFFT
ncbi:unnamed protein product [Lota lota]